MSVTSTQSRLARHDPAGAEVYWLSVDAYHRMIDAGIFQEDDRVELTEGELRLLPQLKPAHAGKNKRLNRLFSGRVGDLALVAVQDPLTLAEHSEPEPDLMLLRPRADFYETANPTPEDVYLVIEIADTSLQQDRARKVPLYAAHGIPEVWLLDLQHRRLEVYRDPSPAGYGQMQTPEWGQTIAPLLLPSVEVLVSELW